MFLLIDCIMLNFLDFLKNLDSGENNFILLIGLLIATLLLVFSINTNKKDSAVNSWPMFWFSMLLILGIIIYSSIRS